MGKVYLVQRLNENGSVSCSLEDAGKIIEMISMLDCDEREIAVFDISAWGEVSRLRVYETWHEPEDPLYIKVTDVLGNLIFDGYGTDH